MQISQVEYKRALAQKGWCEIQTNSTAKLQSELLAFANELGTPIAARSKGEVVHKLFVTSSEQASPKSLSKIHSTGRFPLHTDSAHWPTPCRYIVLGCENSGTGKRSTLLLDWTSITPNVDLANAIRTEPFRVVNGAGSFFATLWSDREKRIRYDAGCMSPTSKVGESLAKFMLSISEYDDCVSFEWSAKKILVIDNWRMLHGRSDSQTHDDKRILWRVLVS